MNMSNRRIVILGKTGVGKSSLANTIFGEKLFQIGHAVNSDTKKCQAVTRPVNGRNITLIDTPGLFDTDQSEEELKSEIVRSIIESAPGPHAVLILLKVERYTEQEHDVITKIKLLFSKEVFKYATVLFTHGDQLEEGKTIKDFYRGIKSLMDLMMKCGGRCHVIDNRYWKNNQQDEYRNNQFQVKELLNTIDEMVEANGGRCYTNKMLQAVEEKIKEEMQRIRLSAGNKSEEEIREEAKDRVFKRLLINLAGITTGVLLGAFFGVVVMGKVVILALGAGLTLVKSAAGGAALAVGAAETGVAAAGGAAAGEAAAAGGAAAAAGAAGTSLIAVTVASAVVGAVAGGVEGYYAAEEADTPLEAAERAAKVVMDGSKTAVDAVKCCLS